MSAQEAQVLYRVRWQLELLFKLWKGVGEIDGGSGWRSQKPERILCEVYAKLPGQIVAQWVIVSSGAWKEEARNLHQMVQTIQKQCFRLASGLGRLGTAERLQDDIELIRFGLSCGSGLNTRKKNPRWHHYSKTRFCLVTLSLMPVGQAMSLQFTSSTPNHASISAPD